MSTRPPSGTRDFLPDDVRRREYVMRIVREVYESYGFEPLETPAFENIETLLGKYGEEGNKLIFKILRRGEHEASGVADMALRYDLTVPLARVVAQYQNELPRLFKRYQIQPVWRADRPARGRFREFYQCDIDAIGSTSPVVEAELLAAVSDVLLRLHFENFIVRLNHRGVLDVILGGIAADQRAGALVAIDKWDKIGPSGVEQDLVSRGIDAGDAQALVAFFSASQNDQMQPGGPVASNAESNTAWCERLRREFPASAGAVDNLESILTFVDETAAKGRLRIDPSLARGLSYYTGAIMEIAVPDLAGSLGGGGRYDNLVGMFSGTEVPACGFSLGLERILVVMTERDMFPAKLARGAVDVVVVAMTDDLRSEAVKLASELRRETLRTEVFPEAARKLDKPFKHATKRNAAALVTIGENERETGTVSFKDLQRVGGPESLPRTTAAKDIRARVRLETNALTLEPDPDC
jgi:histidyl-tRNA synthetase